MKSRLFLASKIAFFLLKNATEISGTSAATYKMVELKTLALVLARRVGRPNQPDEGVDGVDVVGLLDLILVNREPVGQRLAPEANNAVGDHRDHVHRGFRP